MSTTGKPIGLNYARQLASNYRENKLSKGQILTNDTQAVWFSKDVLLEALGVAAGSGSEDITGIRVYFGAYAEEPGYPDNTFDQNKLTLVLVTTGTDKIDIDRNGSPEIAYLDIIDDPGTKPSYPDATNGTTVAGKNYYNEAQLVPPPNSANGLGLLDW
ncbi:MAG: hypothetical protein ABI402_01750 [Ferruginibacter sp.]